MKKAIAIIFFSLITTVITYAQHGRINHRQAHQHVRIHQGVRSGELTHKEAVRLRTEQRSIRRTEHRAKADGKVTRDERARIEHKQDRANRDIYRQKHDTQDRN